MVVAAAPEDKTAGVVDGAGHFGGQAGLADARLASHQYGPRLTGESVLERRLQHVSLALTSHEGEHVRAQARREAGAAATPPHRRRSAVTTAGIAGVAVDDLPLQRLELRRRLETELLARKRPVLLVGAKRLGDAGRPRQRGHQLGSRPLPQRDDRWSGLRAHRRRTGARRGAVGPRCGPR